MAPKRGRPPGARGAGKAKAKAKAAPKATAAPKAPAAPQAATRDASDAELEETLSDDGGGVSTAKKRRQLNRRSSDEQVERALAQRLSHLPDEVWRTKVNKDGLSISEYVKRAHKKMHSDGKKLGTKFWSDVYNEFDLNESCADALEDPPEDLPVSKDLLMALASARSGNPCGTPAAQLERFLERCGVLNRAELYGLFRAAMEGPSLPRVVAVKCQVAILRYLGRTPGFNNS